MEATISSLGSDLFDPIDQNIANSDDGMPDTGLAEMDFMGDKLDDTVLDILESSNPDLTLVIKEYWSDIQKEIVDQPILKLYVAGLYKMANEYSRMEIQIEDMSNNIDTLGTSPALTNERARLRDNMASMTTEGWKLLNALLESLHKIQSMINKIKETSDNTDPFENFITGS